MITAPLAVTTITDLDRDRRTHPRLEVCLPVVLLPEGAPPLLTLTINISCGGFFCRTDANLAPGESIRCKIALAPTAFGITGGGVCLEGVAEVVHTVSGDQSDERVGMGLRLRDYHFVPNPPY